MRFVLIVGYVLSSVLFYVLVLQPNRKSSDSVCSLLAVRLRFVPSHCFGWDLSAFRVMDMCLESCEIWIEFAFEMLYDIDFIGHGSMGKMLSWEWYEMCDSCVWTFAVSFNERYVRIMSFSLVARFMWRRKHACWKNIC